MAAKEIAVTEYRVEASGATQTLAQLQDLSDKVTKAQERQALAMQATASRTERAWQNMQAKTDPVLKAQIAMQREMDRVAKIGAEAQARLGTSHEEVARTIEATRAYHERRIEDIRREIAAANGLSAANDNSAREAQAYTAKVAALREQLDPVGAAQAKMNAELALYADMASRGAITTDELTRAQDLAKRKFEEATGSAEKSGSIIDRLRNSVSRLVLAYAGIQGLRILGGAADQWSELQARVVNATGSFEAGQAVLGRLGEMARRTYSDLDRTAESWLSSSTALGALGVSIGDQLDLVESFNNALVISATRGQRAESVQRAWSDAMSVGKMNMQQFTTVMTGSDRLAQALADSMGVNVLELRKLASEGKITRSEMLGLSSQLETLRKEADAMPATIADGVTLIRNAFLMTIGMMDQAGGASESFAAGLVIIADNMGRIVTYAATAATAYGTYYVGAMVAARLSTLGLAGSLALLRTALIATGIGALVVAAAELVYQFSRLVSAAGGFGNAMSLLGDVASEMWQRIKVGGQGLSVELTAVAWRIKAVFLDAWAAIADAFGKMVDILATGYNAVASRLPGFAGDWTWDASNISGYADEVRRAAEFAHQLSDNSRAAAESIYQQMNAPLESIAALRKVIADAESGARDFGDSLGAVNDNLDKVDENAKKLAEAYKNIVDGAQDFVASQQLEASLIGMSEQAANALRYEFDLLNEARRAGITLTDADRHGFRALAEAMAEAEERTRFLTEAFEFTKSTIKGFFSDLRSGLEEGKGFWESFADAGVNALNKIADKLIEMAFDQMINNILRNLMGTFNFGGFGNTSYFPPAPSGFHLLAGGGQVRGPGTSTSDSIPAWLSDGEFVVRAAAVAQPGMLPILEAINDGNFAVRRAMGGLARMHGPANIGGQRFAHGGLARPQPAYPTNGSMNVTVNVQNNSSAQVEVGEPKQNVDGSVSFAMMINEIKREVASDITSNGIVGRSLRQSFVGMHRRTR